MRGLSVIIPSRDVKNLQPCLTAVRKHESGVGISVVWDGKADYLTPRDMDMAEQLIEVFGNCSTTSGIQPFVFARNCNLGINAAGEDDVILLNDDALLESPGGFTAMQRAAQEHPEYGIISATTNNAGNPMQFRRQHPEHMPLRACPSPTPGNSFATVAFVCVLIPRRTIDAVGTLDERFGGTTAEGKRIYGYEDNDYCRRVHLAGLKVGIYDGCFVDHKKLTSTFRGDESTIDMGAARSIYMEKWGSM